MSSGSEILAGRNSVREALLARRRVIHQVILAEGVGEKGIVEEIVQLARAARVPVERARRQDLDRWGTELKTQGVIARVSGYPYAEVDDLLALAQERGEPPFLLALDSLQDPQNVGSLLRTAEAVGVHGVILPERRAVGITPAVSRASAGAVEWLRVAMVTNLARTLDVLKEAGVWIVGVEDLPEAQDYRQVDLNMPLALVVGSEGRGTRRLVMEKCDLLVRIPMRGHINSLNVSVAGALVLYQAWNARES
jgi:23S rRNA (guanosine2251-2'-O)-methyltransferase